MRRRLDAAGIPHLRNPSHIVPVIVGHPVSCKQMSDRLLHQFGIYVQPINYPTVPLGTERLRITPSPLHSDADIDNLVRALSIVFDPEWAKAKEWVGQSHDDRSVPSGDDAARTLRRGLRLSRLQCGRRARTICRIMNEAPGAADAACCRADSFIACLARWNRWLCDAGDLVRCHHLRCGRIVRVSDRGCECRRGQHGGREPERPRFSGS